MRTVIIGAEDFGSRCISHLLERKLEALMCHSSEKNSLPHPWSLTATNSLAKMGGVLCGCEAAEASLLVRDALRS